MSITIEESGMVFGDFREDSLFYTEKSSIYANLGSGVRTCYCQAKNGMSQSEAHIIAARSYNYQEAVEEDS